MGIVIALTSEILIAILVSNAILEHHNDSLTKVNLIIILFSLPLSSELKLKKTSIERKNKKSSYTSENWSTDESISIKKLN